MSDTLIQQNPTSWW